jgi:hypothetical protein
MGDPFPVCFDVSLVSKYVRDAFRLLTIVCMAGVSVSCGPFIDIWKLTKLLQDH